MGRNTEKNFIALYSLLHEILKTSAFGKLILLDTIYKSKIWD